MKHVANYQLEDFLRDASFKKWVSEGAFQNADTQWSRWLEQFPEKKKLALSAREILMASKLEEPPFPEDYFVKIEKYVLDQVSRRKNRHAYLRYGIAASVLFFILLNGWFWINKGDSDASQTKLADRVSALQENDTFLTADNTTGSIIPVALPDGSSVLLHPESHLHYERKPDGIRTVELKGKAFFEVAPKGPEEAFKVIAGEMVTHVLGTSFTITAFQNEKNFSVIVKTGEVAVNTVSGESDQSGTITLKPNEQVSFNRKDASFIQESISQREIRIHTPATSSIYVFEDTPATEVFKRIGREYGLDIVMDEKLLADCGLTTNLTDEPLFQKLKIICRSIGPATGFSIDGNQIQIFSGGCNQ